MTVAAIGKTTNIVQPDKELKLSPSDLLILDGNVSGLDENWVYTPLKKWAEERNIPFRIMYFYSPKHKPETLWYKEIVDETDRLVVYCDDKIDSIDSLGLYALNYAKESGKEISIIKLPPMFLFHFCVSARGERISEAFTIRKSIQIPYEYARATAMVEAQIEYLKYITKWDFYDMYLYIREKRRKGYGEEWVPINTNEIERWYEAQRRKFNDSIYQDY